MNVYLFLRQRCLVDGRVWVRRRRGSESSLCFPMESPVICWAMNEADGASKVVPQLLSLSLSLCCRLFPEPFWNITTFQSALNEWLFQTVMSAQSAWSGKHKWKLLKAFISWSRCQSLDALSAWQRLRNNGRGHVYDPCACMWTLPCISLYRVLLYLLYPLLALPVFVRTGVCSQQLTLELVMYTIMGGFILSSQNPEGKRGDKTINQLSFWKPLSQTAISNHSLETGTRGARS